MKKIFLLLCIMFAFAGCCNNNVENNPKYARNNEVTGAYFNGGIIEFGYKGHDYIMFKKSNGYQGYAGVVHNPDCHCFTDKK